MINLFARKGIDGILFAACFHQEAKALSEGIHVTFVEKSVDSALLDLLANIELAGGMKAALPVGRRIILYNLRPGQAMRGTLERFLALHPDVEVCTESRVKVSRWKLYLLRVLAFFLRPFMAWEDLVFLLADRFSLRKEQYG